MIPRLEISISKFGSIIRMLVFRWPSLAVFLKECNPSPLVTSVSEPETRYIPEYSLNSIQQDRDGTMDMLFATCSSVSKSTGVGSNCYLNVAYNQQLPLCASSTTSSVVQGKRVCRPPEDLCTGDPDFRFDLSDRSDNDVGRLPSSYVLLPHALLGICACAHIFNISLAKQRFWESVSIGLGYHE